MATQRIEDLNKKQITEESCPPAGSPQSVLSDISQQGFSTNAPKYGTLVPNRIFVGGLSANTKEEELISLFSGYGRVKSIKIICDRAGLSRGYGFVTFESEAEAKRLLSEVDHIILGDRNLNIAPAIKKQPFSSSAHSVQAMICPESVPWGSATSGQYFTSPSAAPQLLSTNETITPTYQGTYVPIATVGQVSPNYPMVYTCGQPFYLPQQFSYMQVPTKYMPCICLGTSLPQPMYYPYEQHQQPFVYYNALGQCDENLLSPESPEVCFSSEEILFGKSSADSSGVNTPDSAVRTLEQQSEGLQRDVMTPGNSFGELSNFTHLSITQTSSLPVLSDPKHLPDKCIRPCSAPTQISLNNSLDYEVHNTNVKFSSNKNYRNNTVSSSSNNNDRTSEKTNFKKTNAGRRNVDEKVNQSPKENVSLHKHRSNKHKARTYKSHPNSEFDSSHKHRSKKN